MALLNVRASTSNPKNREKILMTTSGKDFITALLSKASLKGIPCYSGLCSKQRVSLCANNSIGCKAWREYGYKGGCYDQDKIGRFKTPSCNGCPREKDGCINTCRKMKV